MTVPDPLLDWLLDADPSLRWQVLQDLADAPTAIVRAVRARVATEGWGGRLLAAQGADGYWAGGACFPAGFDGDCSRGQPWTPTLPTLTLLCDLGVDPADPVARAAVTAVQEHCRWEHAGQSFFDGEVEPCINGRTVRVGAYFGVDVATIVDRLLDDQLADGGWNCAAERGSVRSSFHSTICVLEGLLAHEASAGPTAPVTAARRRGERYLLERSLFRRLGTGAPIDETWLRPAFPTWWHYDVLRGLDHFRRTAEPPDPRLAEALRTLVGQRGDDGRWRLGHVHPGAVHVVTDDGVGHPSRWITLRALRVLRWAGTTA